MIYSVKISLGDDVVVSSYVEAENENAAIDSLVNSLVHKLSLFTTHVSVLHSSSNVIINSRVYDYKVSIDDGTSEEVSTIREELEELKEDLRRQVKRLDNRFRQFEKAR